MGMLDCPDCWELWCTCGTQYKDWSDDRKIAVVSAILGMDKKCVETFLKTFKELEEEGIPWDETVMGYVP